jgi:hypothetical protein
MQHMFFYCRCYCLLNVFREPLCPSSGARKYYTVGCRLWSLVLGFQVVGMVWSWGLCVWFAGCFPHINDESRSKSLQIYYHIYIYIHTYIYIYRERERERERARGLALGMSRDGKNRRSTALLQNQNTL